MMKIENDKAHPEECCDCGKTPKYLYVASIMYLYCEECAPGGKVSLTTRSRYGILTKRRLVNEKKRSD